MQSLILKSTLVFVLVWSLLGGAPSAVAQTPCPPVLCEQDDTQCQSAPTSNGCGDSQQPSLQGFGTKSTFGDGPNSIQCVVSTLGDSGPGSLRYCIENRTGAVTSPTPVRVVFETSGTIVLLSDLAIRQPYLTIDGLSAPAPGITIAKQGTGENGETRIQTWPANSTCGHDVLVQGLRFKGVWTRDTESHSQNADMLSIDGEDLPGCIKNVVIWRNTYIDGQDGVGNIWGSVTDTTFAYNLVAYSLHPQSISHAPGGISGQEKKRLSIHHNIYAYTHERTPNIRDNVWDTNLDQNIFHKWDAFGLGGGYSTSFRCRNGGCPLRINMRDNVWTSAGTTLNEALQFTDGANPTQIFDSGNIYPVSENDKGTASASFPNNDGVELIQENLIEYGMFPFVGHPFPSAEEQNLINEVLAEVKASGVQ